MANRLCSNDQSVHGCGRLRQAAVAVFGHEDGIGMPVVPHGLGQLRHLDSIDRGVSDVWYSFQVAILQTDQAVCKCVRKIPRQRWERLRQR